MRLFRFIPNRNRAAMRWNELLDGFALLRRQRCTSVSHYPSNMNNLATSPMPSPLRDILVRVILEQRRGDNADDTTAQDVERNRVARMIGGEQCCRNKRRWPPGDD